MRRKREIEDADLQRKTDIDTEYRSDITITIKDSTHNQQKKRRLLHWQALKPQDQD